MKLQSPECIKGNEQTENYSINHASNKSCIFRHEHILQSHIPISIQYISIRFNTQKIKIICCVSLLHTFNIPACPMTSQIYQNGDLLHSCCRIDWKLKEFALEANLFRCGTINHQGVVNRLKVLIEAKKGRRAQPCKAQDQHENSQLASMEYVKSQSCPIMPKCSFGYMTREYLNHTTFNGSTDEV